VTTVTVEEVTHTVTVSGGGVVVTEVPVTSVVEVTSAAPVLDDLQFPEFRDDFLAGTTDSGQVGELGWIWAGGSTSHIRDTGHPGIVRRTASVVDQRAYLTLNDATVATAIWEEEDTYDLTFIVRAPLDAVGAINGKIVVGLALSVDTAPQSASGRHHFIFDYGTDTNWQAETRQYED
jgi:phage baseplate assembly protein gpV